MKNSPAILATQEYNAKIKYSKCLDVFDDYIHNDNTRYSYRLSFFRFLRYYHLTDPVYLLTLSNEELFEKIQTYIRFLKQKVENGQNKPQNVKNELAGTKHFLTYNDRILNWKKINKMLPGKEALSGQKAYTLDLIQKLFKSTTKIRLHFLITFMASTGCRVGAVTEIKLKHITPIEDCYCVTFYAGSREEYIGFMTPECSRLYEQFLEKRKLDCEALTNESLLFTSEATNKRDFNRITTKSIQSAILRIVWKAGLRGQKEGRRYEASGTHAFRKFFATQLKQCPAITYSVSERLLGHQAYLDTNYFRPTREELFESFKKAIQLLTIDTTKIQEYKIKQLEKEITEKEQLKDQVERLQQAVKQLQEQKC